MFDYALMDACSFDYFPVEIMTIIIEKLAEIWPAGAVVDEGLQLGWITISHVDRRTRHICLSSSRLWARKAFSFKNTSTVREFIRRADGIPITVDLNGFLRTMTYEECISRPLDTILNRTTLASARVIRARVTSALAPVGYNGLSRLLSGVTFNDLVTIDVHLERYAAPIEPFSAPRLLHLSISSDSRKSEHAPMIYNTLRRILDLTPQLHTLRLDRVVDTSEGNRFATNSLPACTLQLKRLKLVLFDETVAVALGSRVHLELGSEFSCHFLTVLNPSLAVKSAQALAAVEFSEMSVVQKTGFNSDAYDMRTYEIYAAELRHESVSITYPLFWTNPKWTWIEFISLTRCETISRATFDVTETLDHDQPPNDLSLEIIVHSLRFIDELRIMDSGLINVKDYVPDPGRLRTMKVPCDDYLALTSIEQWLLNRPAHSVPLTLTVTGMAPDLADEVAVTMDEQTMARITHHCTVEDLRVRPLHTRFPLS